MSLGEILIVAKLRSNLPLFVSALIALVVVLQVSRMEADLARSKYFWTDESLDLTYTCPNKLSDTLLNGGVGQCSPPPLYYLVERISIPVLNSFIGDPLLLARVISLVAAALALSLFFLIFAKALTPAFGFFSLIFLINQPTFHHFAAENRPYMLWLWLYAFVLFYVARGSLFNQSESKVHRIFFSIICMGLTLVSGAGVIQVCACFAAFCALHWRRRIKFRELWEKPNIRFFTFLTVSCFAIGIYYTLKSCHYLDGGKFDLLKTRDMTLIRDVVSLFWVTGTSVGALFNFILVVGIVGPLLWWPNRNILNSRQLFLLRLSVVCVFQIGASLCLAALIVRAHYYFVARVFIYLIVLRASLIVAGFSFLFFSLIDWLNARSWSSKFLKFANVMLIVIVFLGLAGSLYRANQTLSGERKLYENKSPTMPKLECAKFNGPIVVTFKGGNISNTLNFYTSLKRELAACSRETSGPERFVTGDMDVSQGSYTYSLSDKLMPESQLLTLCGLPLSIP
jgi:hypothetical protein